MSESPDVARRYADLEKSLEPQRKRSIARGPIGLIAVLIVLSLAVGVVAAVDLRRLQTARGTALAWAGAAVFGDCTAYERLSVPPAGAGNTRSAQESCVDLRRETEQAREESGRFGIELLTVEQEGRRATATVRVTRPSGVVELPLQLRRQGDGWVVVRTFELCLLIGCP